MTGREEQIQHLEAAIAAQEALRPLLGDTVVGVAIAALQAQLTALRQAATVVAAPAEDRWLAQLQSYLPPELAAKIRALGRIEGERRQVTVLFADLSGFTALSEQLDPEEVTAIMNDALQEMAAAVYACEGYIDKFIGDAVMAVFGAPIAHEDDPERALRAALQMRERMEHLNYRWQRQLVAPLTLHIGINTGLAIAGTVGTDARLSYTVMGDTVNTAARLESAARPGQILVSRTTYRLTQMAFQFLALEPIQVKGRQEPVVIYELLAARTTPEKRRGVRDLQDVFLGREAELATLAAQTAQLLQGEGHVLVVSGEAGMGKSRLMAEWRRLLAGRVRWIEGRAFHHTSGLPYGPFLDLLRRLVGIRDEDSEAQARARFDHAMGFWPDHELATRALLAMLLGVTLEPAERAFLDTLADDGVRRRLRDAMTLLLQALGAAQPLALVLEDMHWADTSSLELIEHLLPLAQQRPLLIVIILRSYAHDMPIRLKTYLDSVPPTHRTLLALQPLSTAQSRSMVQQLLGQPTLPAAVLELLEAKAEGNPFYVEEVLRMLIDRGALMRDGDAGWVATDVLRQVTVPDTLQGVLMARLDRLYPETKWVLQQASVIGRVFLYRVLLHLEQHQQLDTDLSILEREELIRERARTPDVEYMFKHALTQEVAYQSLLATRRKELHRRTGEAMEQLFADRLHEVAPILARHFTVGEGWERALHYLLQAGDQATRLYAQPEARAHYHEALQVLDHLPATPVWQRTRVEVTIRLAKVSLLAEAPLLNLDRLQAAEQLLGSLPAEAAAADDDLRLARIHYWMGTFHVLQVGGLPAAMPYFAQVLPVAEAYNDPELLMVPSMIIGRGMTVRGYFRDACPLFERVLPLLAQAEDWTEWILTQVFLGLARAAGGDYAAGLALIEEARARAEQLNNLTGQVYGHMFLAAAAMHGRDAAGVRDASVRALQLAQASGDRLYEYFSYGYQAWAWSQLGDHAQAAQCLATCQTLEAGLGGQLVLSDWFAAVAAEVALAAGRPAEAQALAARCVTQAEAIGGIFALGMAHRVWAEALLADPATPAAAIADHLRLSREALLAGGAVLDAARTDAVAARLCQRTGDRAGVQQHAVAAVQVLVAAGLTLEADQLRETLALAPQEAAEAVWQAAIEPARPPVGRD